MNHTAGRYKRATNPGERAISEARQARNCFETALPGQKFFQSARVEKAERGAFDLIDLHTVKSLLHPGGRGGPKRFSI
jgi:hypothetical protein